MAAIIATWGCSGSASPTNAAPTSDAPRPLRAKVEHVVDGDTITVRLSPPYSTEETVRLLGVDTPEKPGGPRPPECHGESATAFTEEMLPVGTEVDLIRDVETRDVYGRLLAYVVRSEDQTPVNLALVQQGHATALFIAPNNGMRSEIHAAAADARRARRGFWSECDGLPYPLSD